MTSTELGRVTVLQNSPHFRHLETHINHTIYIFSKQVLFIPKVIIHIKQKPLLLRKVKSIRKQATHNVGGIIFIVRISTSLKRHDKIIGESFINFDLAQLLMNVFKARKVVGQLILTTLSVFDLKIKFLQEKYPPNQIRFWIFLCHEISMSFLIYFYNHFSTKRTGLKLSKASTIVSNYCSITVQLRWASFNDQI